MPRMKYDPDSISKINSMTNELERIINGKNVNVAVNALAYNLVQLARHVGMSDHELEAVIRYYQNLEE
jgi:hypothetical protein